MFNAGGCFVTIITVTTTKMSYRKRCHPCSSDMGVN